MMTDEVKQGTSVKKKLNVKRGSLINKKLRTWAEKKKKSRKLATQTAENSINVTSEGLATSSLCSSASFFFATFVSSPQIISQIVLWLCTVFKGIIHTNLSAVQLHEFYTPNNRWYIVHRKLYNEN